MENSNTHFQQLLSQQTTKVYYIFVISPKKSAKGSVRQKIWDNFQEHLDPNEKNSILWSVTKFGKVFGIAVEDESFRKKFWEIMKIYYGKYIFQLYKSNLRRVLLVGIPTQLPISSIYQFGNQFGEVETVRRKAYSDDKKQTFTYEFLFREFHGPLNHQSTGPFFTLPYSNPAEEHMSELYALSPENNPHSLSLFGEIYTTANEYQDEITTRAEVAKDQRTAFAKGKRSRKGNHKPQSREYFPTNGDNNNDESSSEKDTPQNEDTYTNVDSQNPPSEKNNHKNTIKDISKSFSNQSQGFTSKPQQEKTNPKSTRSNGKSTKEKVTTSGRIVRPPKNFGEEQAPIKKPEKNKKCEIHASPSEATK